MKSKYSRIKSHIYLLEKRKNIKKEKSWETV